MNASYAFHPPSTQCPRLHTHALTIGGTVLKESDDLDILEVTFDSEMSFKNHLR